MTGSLRAATPVESPCNRTCRIDPATRLCVGCYRSIDEITAWGQMTPEERSAVMAELAERRPVP